MSFKTIRFTCQSVLRHANNLSLTSVCSAVSVVRDTWPFYCDVTGADMTRQHRAHLGQGPVSPPTPWS